MLEKHRRIYRRLVDLESPRWTPRERSALIDQLRNEIELLWLTGELRLEKPTVPQEVYWGLHFFNETLFDAVPELLEKLERALRRSIPASASRCPPFFQFGSWIGGDRDGNPVRHQRSHPQTLNENRLASLRALPAAARRAGPGAQHHRARGAGLPGASAAALDARSRPAVTRSEIVLRNPGEVFRQYLACMTAAARRDARGRGARAATPAAAATPRPTQLVADLRLLERGADGRLGAAPRASCRAPMRREVEVVPLQHRPARPAGELRPGSTPPCATLWRLRKAGEPPSRRLGRDGATGSLAELARAPRPGDVPPSSWRTTGETLGMFRLVARVSETRSTARRSASFVLSMTRSSSDVLGVYLLAKEAGLFADPAAVESCTLPIVPLFETIDDLQRAPAIMRELLGDPAGAAQRPGAGRRAGGDDRLLRLQQGRRLPHLQLGACKAQTQAHPAGRGVRGADRLLPRPRRLGEPRRRADRPRHRGPAGRLDPRAPAASPSRARSSPTSTPTAAPRRTRSSCWPRASSSTPSSRSGRRRWCRAGEFDEALEALSGAAQAAYRRLVEHPELLHLLPGREPARGAGAAQHRLPAGPALRAPGRWPTCAPSPGSSPGRRTGTSCPAGIGVGSGLATFLEVRGRAWRGAAQADVHRTRACSG